MRGYQPRSSQYALRGKIFEFYRFYRHSLFGTPSGGSIFRCTTKDRGERRAKGVATPFNPPELMRDSKPDVLCAYLPATVRLTRLSRLRCREANTLGVRSAYSLASACCAAQKDQSTPATTRLPSLQNLGYSVSVNDFTAVGAVGKSPAEPVLAAMKLPQKGGAWLSGGAVQSGHRRHATGRA